MTPEENLERKLVERFRYAAGGTLRERMLARVLQAHDESRKTSPARNGPEIRSIAMRGRMSKSVIAAAVIVVAVVFTVSIWDRSVPTAYAIEQTVEALQNVRFLHLMQRDDAGQMEDERWIEIGMDGLQVRYRQDNSRSRSFGVVEDGESTAVYRHDKQAVIIYDREEMQYQWVGELGKAFENLRQEGTILEEKGIYGGQAAHKVWWPLLSAECYVDPATKLPLAIGDTELSYEEPPAGTFDIIIPEGYAVLDKRPGAEPGPVPDWLLAEEEARQQGREAFREGTFALASGDFATAAERFELAVKDSPRRNWAWFWLGSAYYGLGEYELAIEKFNKVLEIFGDKPCGYCNYARGLAYARLGKAQAAAEDLTLCLPGMIRTLRIPSAGMMFEYAENPMIRYGEYKPTEQEMVVRMVNRLRIATGQNFGFDAMASAGANEAAIAAWEAWFDAGGKADATPDAELLEVVSVGN